MILILSYFSFADFVFENKNFKISPSGSKLFVFAYMKNQK